MSALLCAPIGDEAPGPAAMTPQPASAAAAAAWLTRPRGKLAGQDAARTAQKLRHGGAEGLHTLVKSGARLFMHASETLTAGGEGEAPGG